MELGASVRDEISKLDSDNGAGLMPLRSIFSSVAVGEVSGSGSFALWGSAKAVR